MANFSVNQVRQFYVVGAKKAADAVTAKGDIAIKSFNEGVSKSLYFLYKGADSMLKSDIINVKNIDCVEVFDADDLKIPMRKVEVSLNADPVAGQEYVLGINFRNFFCDSDDSQYYKDAVVLATSGMTKTQFFAAMKTALDNAFAREDGATSTSNPYLEFTASGAKLIIEEKPQEWTLGIKKQRRIAFDVLPSTIYVNSADVRWGTVTAVASSTFVGNGHKIADLEYFCMGERGDQYRMIGWPNYVKTDYMVDPTADYHVLEIHYAFTDSGVNSYRTEKEITIVSTTKSVITGLKSDIDALINPAPATPSAG